MGRQRLGIASGSATEVIVNSIARLFNARPSADVTEPFTKMAYFSRRMPPNVTQKTRRLDVTLGLDLGLIELVGTADDGEILYRYVEDATLPDALAERVRFASAKVALMASGVAPVDADLFASLDEIYRLVGLREFSLNQLLATPHFEEYAATLYLSRAVARGSLEMTQYGSFRIRPRALSSGGRVGRGNLGMSSRFVTEFMVNSVALLIETRSSGALTGPFTRADYGRRRPLALNGRSLSYELALGEDLGLIGTRGNTEGGEVFYFYVEGARLPDVLAEKIRSASAKLASRILGATRADASLFSFMDTAFGFFGHRGFSLGQIVEQSRLNRSSVVYLLNRPSPGGYSP